MDNKSNNKGNNQNTNPNNIGNKKVKFKPTNTIFYVFLLLIFIILFQMLNVSASKEVTLTYSEFNELITKREFKGKPAPKIKSAEIIKKDLNSFEFHGKLNDLVSLSQLRGEDKSSGPFKSKDSKFNKFMVEIPQLKDADFDTWNNLGFDYKFTVETMGVTGVLLSIFPWLLFIGIMFFMMRNMGQGGGSKGIFNFGKSKAQLYDDGGDKITFDDVAGCDESKFELEEVVDFLKYPKKYDEIGAKIPKGILLVGPPGTGKTLLAKAVAGEAGVPFFSISGSDFVEMFVGVGASRVRDMFENGKKYAPCILFIDEIDAVARQRGTGVGGGHDEREQTLNQLLVEMDGMSGKTGMIVIAATNRPDILDPAILRPGRFDRNVVIDRPDVKGREGILKVHVEKRKVPVASDVDLSRIAKTTPGMSGAELANIVNEAALFAARLNRKEVNKNDFEQARDKIMMGIERKNRMTEEELEMTAYHEAGHAICTHYLGGAHAVHKVTIIPRGMSLGSTHMLPTAERYGMTKKQLLSEISVALGGRVAEMVVFNEETTGASGDIRSLTRTARKMVCEWGMSEKLGTIALEERKETMFLGREVDKTQEYSEKTAELIDEEVKRIVEEQTKEVFELLTSKREELDNLAKALLKYETIDGSEMDAILSGEDLDRETAVEVAEREKKEKEIADKETEELRKKDQDFAKKTLKEDSSMSEAKITNIDEPTMKISPFDNAERDENKEKRDKNENNGDC